MSPPGPEQIVELVLAVVEAGASGVMFSETYAGGTVRMVREATSELPNPPAIYGHNAGIGVKTRSIWREVIDLLARLDGIDFRQTAPLRPGSPFIRPYGAEWHASEEALTRPIPGINPTMITRAGALDQGNIILNLEDLESKGIAQNVLFLAGSAINSIKGKDGKPDPRIGLEAMIQAIDVHRSGELKGIADGRAPGGAGGPGRAEEPGRAFRGASAAVSGEDRMIAKDERCSADRRAGLRADRAVRSLRRLPQGQERRALRHLRPRRRPARANGRRSISPRSPTRTTTRCWPTRRSRRSSSRSPTSFTSPAALKAIEAGKHVLVEKPLGTTIESCRELRDRAAAAGLVVQVGNNRRFDPGIAFARKFIAEEMGQRIALKSWYYDSVYRYTMTDNLQPIPITSAKALAPGGRSQGRPAALLPAHARQPPGRHGAVPGWADRGRARAAARTIRVLTAGSSPSTLKTARSAISTCRSRSAATFRKDFRSSASTAA